MNNFHQAYKIHKTLNQEEYFKQLTTYNEDSRLTINTNGFHSKYYAVIEIEDIIIGIRHEIGGPYPIIKQNQSNFYIGVDNKIFVLSLSEKRVTSQIELDSPFIDLYFLSEDNNSILIIEECGVSKFSLDWNKKWFCGTDLVTSHHLANSTIVISQPDAPSVTISLKTGKPL